MANIFKTFCVSVLMLSLLFSAVIARQKTVISKVGRIIGKTESISLNNDDNKSTEITSFLGIPYAEPPIMDRRFLKSVPKTNFTEAFNASEYGPSCPQNSPGFTAETIDEDCLYLNIHIPVIATSGSRLAVMIWIHGGGFILGNGRVFGGQILAAYGKVVVVTINYRLGPFGFLSTNDDQVDANAGLYDQHLAIKWVHDNIEEFGGDVSRITIFGESAGAVSVIHQLLYPLNKGLFHRAIAESGSANLPSAITDKPLDRAKQFASETGCPVTSTKHMIKCLRNLTVSQLLNSTGLWTPSYDGLFVIKDRVKALDKPSKSVNLDVFKGVDLMMGTNKYEGQLFIGGPPFTELYNQLINSSTPIESFPQIISQIFKLKLKQVYKDRYKEEIFDAVSFEYTNFKDPGDRSLYIQQACNLLTDIEFYVPSFNTIERHAYNNNNNSKTFQYEFNEHYPFMKRDFWVDGALHADELPYVFGFPQEMKSYYGNYTKGKATSQWFLSSRMMYFWTNFAKSGNPNIPSEDPLIPVYGDIPVWSEYRTTNRNYMYITSADLSNKIELYARRVQLWTKYIPHLLVKRDAPEKNICVLTSKGESFHECSIFLIFCFLIYFFAS